MEYEIWNFLLQWWLELHRGFQVFILVIKQKFTFSVAHQPGYYLSCTGTNKITISQKVLLPSSPGIIVVKIWV